MAGVCFCVLSIASSRKKKVELSIKLVWQQTISWSINNTKCFWKFIRKMFENMLIYSMRRGNLFRLQSSKIRFTCQQCRNISLPSSDNNLTTKNEKLFTDICNGDRASLGQYTYRLVGLLTMNTSILLKRYVYTIAMWLTKSNVYRISGYLFIFYPSIKSRVHM